MVQPLSATASARGSELASQARPPGFISTGKRDEFRHCLGAEKLALRSGAEGGEASSSSLLIQPDRERQMLPEEGASPSLAPEEPAGWGRSPEAAEWLSSIAFGEGFNDAAAGGGAVPTSSATRAVEPELTALVEGWVRRVALGGDQRRAVARLDIGHGSYAGAELVIAAEAGQVSVELTLPEGTEAGALIERLRSRLMARGYAAEVSVR